MDATDEESDDVFLPEEEASERTLISSGAQVTVFGTDDNKSATMKKVLLAVSWPHNSPHPSLDVLIACSLVVSAERGARFLLVPIRSTPTSSQRLQKFARMMLDEPPHSLKLLYLGCAPTDADEAEFLLNLRQASVYILDTTSSPFGPLLGAAPHISYQSSSEESVSVAATRLYFAEGRDTSWRRILSLHRFLHFHGRDGLDLLPAPASQDLLVDLDRLYRSHSALGSSVARLFLLLRHVTDFTDSFPWSDLGNDAFADAGALLERVLLLRAFLDQLTTGGDPDVFSATSLQRYRDREDVWRRAIASGRLVSVPVGLQYSPRFVGAIFVVHGRRAALRWMSPGVAEALERRAKAQCLLMAEEREDGVIMRVLRASSKVDCLAVARALGARTEGSQWEAKLECGREEYLGVRNRLKLDREVVELRNVRPVVAPSRASERETTTARKVSSGSPPSRLRSRNTMMSLNSETLIE